MPADGRPAWCYGAIGWRLATRRRMSGLPVLTVIGLATRTAWTFASGDTFTNLVQPAVNNGLLAALEGPRHHRTVDMRDVRSLSAQAIGVLVSVGARQQSRG